jgi:hypothetical protein
MLRHERQDRISIAQLFDTARVFGTRKFLQHPLTQPSNLYL